MSQVKPISHGIDNFKKLIIELNRNFDTVIKLINSNNKVESDKPEYQKTTKEYHLFGGSNKDSFAARYYGLGYVTGPDSVPNNSIYTSGNGFYYIKDQDGVSREIGSTGGGGAYLPIDGTAVNSELLDGYDSSEFTFKFDFNSHTGDDSIHFLGTDIDHTAIKNIGTYSHDTIDTHVDNSTIHFAESNINHINIQNIGTNSHLDIDTHISESSIHFTESSIDHTAIQNIGTNTHTDIDSHISNTGNPHTTTLDQVITANNTTTQNFTTGRQTIRTADISGLTLDNTNSPYFIFKSSSGKTSMEIFESGGQKGVIAGTDGSALTGGISLGYSTGTSTYKFRCNGDMFIDGDIYTPDTAFRFKQELDVNGNKVWNAGNDGSLSGLDADLLDGNHASYFATDAAFSTHTSDSTIHFIESSIDHTTIQNIGINTHTQIDTHIANVLNPHTTTLDLVTDAGNTTTNSVTFGSVVEASNTTESNIKATRGTITSSLQQNSSGGAILLNDSSDTTNCIIRGYGDSYFNGGSVGVGTASPGSPMHVKGDVTDTDWGHRVLTLESTTSDFPGVAFYGPSGGLAAIRYNATNDGFDFLRLDTDGTNGGNIIQFDSDGIIQESWNTLTLNNSWVEFDTARRPQYMKTKEDEVYVRGLIKNGTVTDGTTIATLPANYIPSQTLYITTASASYSSSTVNPPMLVINTTGSIQGFNLSSIYTSVTFNFKI